MVQHLKTDIARGAKIYEAKRHSSNNHFTVRVVDKEKSRTVYANILELTLIDDLGEANQLDGIKLHNLDFGRIVFPGNLKEALQESYKISEYHLDSPSSANVTLSKENCIDVFVPEVPLEDLGQALQIETELLLSSSKEHLTFSDAISQGWPFTDKGYVVVQFHKHENNKNYSCQLLKESKIKTFANVSPSHLREAIGANQVPLLNSWITSHPNELESLEKVKPKGINFMTCVRLGGRIVKFHDTAAGRVSVWIETLDGTVHHFSGLKKESIEGVMVK